MAKQATGAKVSLRRSAEDALIVPEGGDSVFNIQPPQVKVTEELPLPAPSEAVIAPAQVEPAAAAAEATLAGTIALLNLLRQIGEAFRLLCRYDCFEAVEAFKQLPPEQYNTGWVLVNVGRAYFEMIEYSKARDVFDQVRLIEPQRLQGMEVFSTTLWHLRRETDLSFLGQELSEINKNAPETLCTIGNCFSLQKEHEMALKYFQRVRCLLDERNECSIRL